MFVVFLSVGIDSARHAQYLAPVSEKTDYCDDVLAETYTQSDVDSSIVYSICKDLIDSNEDVFVKDASNVYYCSSSFNDNIDYVIIDPTNPQ
jgi:hypothetical protein